MKDFLFGWLRTRRFFLLLWTLMLVLLAAFSYLFGITGGLLNYQLSLLILFGTVCLGLDIWQEYRKFARLIAGQPLSSSQSSASEATLANQLEEARTAHRELRVQERVQREEVMDYFALWAHQIKIPLTASRLLLKEIPDGHGRQGLEQELFKVEQYTDLAMNYLRLESFHDDLVLREENLHDLVREAVRKYALFFIQKKIKLVLEDFDRTLVTDRKWFAIILEQILSNSLKYTQQGEIHIFTDDNRLVIADTGIGIQAGDLKRVFERGFSGYNGRSSQQSSGLGLYLSKTIADKLGHELNLTSQAGEGTQVSIGLRQAQLAQD